MFDPDSIRRALKANLVDGLRAIADAVEAKEIDGYFVGAGGNGLFYSQDDRAHVWVTIDVAAQIFRWEEGKKVPLDAPTIALPAELRKELL